MSERVRGQPRAINEIVDRVYAAKHHVAEIIEPAGRMPAMVLFFVGPTGVGKTLAAAALCEALSGSLENLKRFDMSEFQREHSDQRLIGSPPGYVGYSEGGQLTNWVLSRPHSVVLIDECEKANERILDIFLQILEGARLTDGKGSTVDMSETILIFTSNLGTDDALMQNIDRNDPDAVENFFLRYVEEYFREDLGRPEIYNRLKKGVVVFDYIPASAAEQVIDDKLRQLKEGIRERSGGVTDAVFADDVRSLVQREANYTEYGLRDVNNAVYSALGGAVGRALDRVPPPARVVFREGVGKKARPEVQ
jgi:ATP-dependent Clp protease ATP-binding subunit ClpA